MLTHDYASFFVGFAHGKQNGLARRPQAISILTDLQHLRRTQLALPLEATLSTETPSPFAGVSLMDRLEQVAGADGLLWQGGIEDTSSDSTSITARTG